MSGYFSAIFPAISAQGRSTRNSLRCGAMRVAVLAAVLLLAACAPGQKYLRSGSDLIDQGRVEEGLGEMEKAVKAEPNNQEYLIKFYRQRELQSNSLLIKADDARANFRFDEAAALYQRVLGFDANNRRARVGMDAVDLARRHHATLAEASTLFANGKSDEAMVRVQSVLTENPGNTEALQLRRQLDAAVAQQSSVVGVRSSLQKKVTLEFRDANLKAVFEALSRSTGLNFIFDRDVRPDIKVTLFVTNVTVEDMLSIVTVTNQLEKRYLSDNTILIYPNVPAKQKDYQELTVKTFYLANAEAKQIMAMLRTIIKSKDIYADEKLNSITLRDTPEAVRLAEKLIAAQDLAEPEVMLEVEILEIKRSRLLDLGVNPPTQFSVLNIVKNPDTVTATASGTITTQNLTTTTTQLTLDKLRGIAKSSIGVNNPSLNIQADNSDANLLANPRIRVRNREKAKIHIGDRVPVITTTTTANVGTSESVTYLDVGLKLDVEPTIYLDDEVAVKMGLEVSSIVREVTSKSGSLTYQIGTRAANTVLRLKDGETQALAGLISDEDRKSASGIPGLIDLPIVSRLFSAQKDDRSKTEIVLLLTPRIVRNIAYPRTSVLEYSSGTESAVGAAPLRLRTGKATMPPSNQAGMFTPPQQIPDQEPAPPPPPPIPTPVPAPQRAQPVPPAEQAGPGADPGLQEKNND